MWNKRYARDDYFYGTQPNTFLAEHAGKLTGPVLSLAEGEGRNGVYLASLGLDVLGVDGSSVGLEKAQKLAKEQGVSIETQIVDLTTYTPPAEAFGAVVSIFAHLPSPDRRRLHGLVVQALKPGGILLLEGYSKAQLEQNYGTGGPPYLDMLLDPADLQQDFADLDIQLIHQIERDVVEGTGHTGLASVVQVIAQKKPEGAA